MYERIMQLLHERDLKPTIVERELNWGSSSIKKMQTNSPSVNKIIDLANYLEVSVSYILTGNVINDDLKDDEVKLIGLYRQLSEKDKLRIIERSETLLESEQD